MDRPLVRVIVNPRAGGGSAERAVPAIVRAFERCELSHQLVMTAAPGDATLLARDAVNDGCDVIAVVGGDGSMNEVVQAYLAEEERTRRKPPDLALIPAGSRGDW